MKGKRRSMKALVVTGAVLALLATAGSSRADETVWLSSLELNKARQGFGKPGVDKSVDGHSLTLNGQVFTHGFGTHSPGLLAVALHGARRFTATVGIDDEAGAGRGSADFQILGDGNKPLWKSGVMRQGQPPKTADVDLTGVQQVILRVTTTGDGFEFDHADWADARFTVTGARPETVDWTPSVANPTIAMTQATPAPEINPPFVAGVRPDTPFLWTVPVTGTRPLTFSAKGLPRGLTLNAKTGTVTGKVTKTGNYAVQVQAKNAFGRAARTVHINVGDRLVLTPPLGWNSYDYFGDRVTEAETLANARYLAQNMQPLGWDTVVVDYRWYDPAAPSQPDNGAPGEVLTMDAHGRLLPAPNRFPSANSGNGFQGLADQVHALGLKFGIHIMRGIPRNAVGANLPIDGSTFKAADAANTSDTCGWCPDMYGVRGATAAGQAYYDSLFRLYASWGVDYVKMDDTSAPYHTDEIEAVHNAIAKCGRSIVYSLSPGETPVEQAAHVAGHANLWRVSGDFWDDWSPLDHEFTLGARWHDFVGPGHWPDADMLPLGHLSRGNRPVGRDRRTNFTKPEQMTLVSLWSLLPSPLMVGANLPDNDPWTLALLTNPEVLAVNQDALGAAGRRVAGQDEWDVWAKPLADGSVAVGLFNRGDFDDTVSVSAKDLGLSGPYALRDLWQRKDLGALQGRFSAPVPAHGVVLLRLQRGNAGRRRAL